MNHFAVGFALGLVIVCGGIAHAQTRSWSFSRDTVTQLRLVPGADTVRLTNSGVDTLRFDSVRLELMAPTAQHYKVAFYPVPRLGQTQPYVVSYDSGTVSGYNSFPDFRSIQVKPQDSVRFSTFMAGRNPLLVSKRAAIKPGDTVVVRMIFIASGGRGRDTLIVDGRENGVIGVSPAFGKKTGSKGSLERFDPRGRRVEKISEGKRIPRTPLLSPKE